jgi:hypothetical protein
MNKLTNIERNKKREREEEKKPLKNEWKTERNEVTYFSSEYRFRVTAVKRSS